MKKLATCPVCHRELKLVKGNLRGGQSGHSAYCEHLDCPAQEVEGFGRTEADAIQVILHKYK